MELDRCGKWVFSRINNGLLIDSCILTIIILKYIGLAVGAPSAAAASQIEHTYVRIGARNCRRGIALLSDFGCSIRRLSAIDGSSANRATPIASPIRPQPRSSSCPRDACRRIDGNAGAACLLPRSIRQPLLASNLAAALADPGDQEMPDTGRFFAF